MEFDLLSPNSSAKFSSAHTSFSSYLTSKSHLLFKVFYEECCSHSISLKTNAPRMDNVRLS